MSIEQDAFENLQRLAVQFAGIIKIAPDLQKMGSLKGAIAEAQARLDEIKKEEATLPEHIKKMIAQAEQKAVQIESEGRGAADKLRNEAAQEHSVAVTHANEIVDAGHKQADKYLIDIKASAGEYEARITKAQAALADIEQKRNAAMADIEAGKRDREKVDDYQKQVDAAKRDLSAFEQRKAAVLSEIEQLNTALETKQTAHDRITEALTGIASKIGLR